MGCGSGEHRHGALLSAFGGVSWPPFHEMPRSMRRRCCILLLLLFISLPSSSLADVSHDIVFCYNFPRHIRRPVARVTGYDTPFPLAFEKHYLPDALKVFEAIKGVLNY